MAVSCCFRTNQIKTENRIKLTVSDFLVIVINFMMENPIHLLLQLRQNDCKQLQNLLDSALVRIVGRNGWSQRWKVNVYILPSRGQT